MFAESNMIAVIRKEILIQKTKSHIRNKKLKKLTNKCIFTNK